MTKNEELRYLCNLLLESARWERSEGETKSGVELEIGLRISQLVPEDGYDGVKVTGETEVHLDPETLTPKDKSRNKHARYAETHVRVTGPDGKKHWYPKEECVQVPVTTGGTGFAWKLKKEVQDV